MIRHFAVLVAFLAAVPALAGGGSDLKTLTTGDDSRGWEGVGRLNIADRSFCTGALIAENLVLTAGHCLYDHDAGSLARPEDVDFLAGWRGGRAAAYRGARRLVVHPGYIADGAARSLDLALIELDQPIRSTSVLPFETGKRGFLARDVGVVSYAHDRAELPSMQDICHVLGRTQGTLVLDCDVDFGSSGAPVFDLSADRPRIISVVSAKGMVGEQKVSLGTDLEGPLAEMQALLEGHGTGLSGGAPRAIGAGPDPSHAVASSGAKFVRP